VKAEDVASILRCSECGAVWLPADEERWRAYIDCDDEIQVFCPDCAVREFEDQDSA
jgi:hypothetical protein